MKIILSLLFLLSISIAAICQKNQDVVYLKNGEVHRGTIVQTVPGEFVQLQVGLGKILFFNDNQIEKITSEAPLQLSADSLATYGGSFSAGAAVGGGGLLGVPLRFQPGGGKVAFEIGAFYRPFILKYYDSYEVKGGLRWRRHSTCR